MVFRGAGVVLLAISALAVALLPKWAAAQAEDTPAIVRQLLDEADAHQRAGDRDKAVAQLREAIRLAPETPQAYLPLGSLLYQGGDVAGALEIFEAGLKLAPDDHALLFNAAAAYVQLGRPAVALELVDRGAAAEPKNPEWHRLRGRALLAAGKKEEALASLATVVELLPEDASARFALGNAFSAVGKKGDAIAAYRHTVKLDPSYEKAYFNLGALLAADGKPNEAVDAYNRGLAPYVEALKKGKAVPALISVAYQNLGAILLKQDRLQEALTAYTSARTIAPEDAQVLYNLGYALYRLARREEAEAVYREAIAKNPALPRAYVHLAELALRKDEPKEAKEWLEKGLSYATAEVQVEAQLTLARASRALGDWSAAAIAYENVLAQAPDTVPALAPLALYRLRSGDLEAAKSLLTRAADVAPDNVSVQLALAEVARRSGNAAAAHETYRELVDLAGKRQEIWPVRIRLALSYAERGQYPQARDALEPVLALGMPGGNAPADVVRPSAEMTLRLRCFQALLLAATGKRAEAETELQAILREREDLTPALLGLAALRLSRGDRKGARASIEKLPVEDRAEISRGEAAAGLGILYWFIGDAAKARASLDRALGAGFDGTALRMALADLAMAQKKEDEALEHLRLAWTACNLGAHATRPPGTGATPAPATAVAGPPIAVVHIGDSADASTGACAYVSQAYGGLLVGSVFRAVAQSAGDRDKAREMLDVARNLPLTARSRAELDFLSGSLAVSAGRFAEARDEISAALTSKVLTGRVLAAAQNNLAIALFRLGRLDEARAAFAAAATSTTPSPAASLNTGILTEETGGTALDAVPHYEKYVSQGGMQRRTVESWIAAIRRLGQ